MNFETIRDLIAKQLNKPKEKIELKTKIVEDLGADSLDLVEMLMSLEDHFKVTVPDEVAANLSTVEDIVKFIDANV